MTLEILTSDVLAPVRHGFFTRRGGASSGVFAGLNCGLGSSDQSDAVEINRERVAHAMAGTADRLRGLKQVHSGRAIIASTDRPATAPEADGIVTDSPGLILAVLTADCAPVLLADTDAGVIGAAHAGWRGALSGILEATVERMVDLGAERRAIRAVLGPTISQRAYEVGEDLFEAFVDEDPGNARFFAGQVGAKLHLDLPGFALHRLRESGVGTAEWIRHCTYSEPELFFSYRRSLHNKQADYGRLISTIAL
jgi:YfiH family protein